MRVSRDQIDGARECNKCLGYKFTERGFRRNWVMNVQLNLNEKAWENTKQVHTIVWCSRSVRKIKIKDRYKGESEKNSSV